MKKPTFIDILKRKKESLSSIVRDLRGFLNKKWKRHFTSFGLGKDFLRNKELLYFISLIFLIGLFIFWLLTLQRKTDIIINEMNGLEGVSVSIYKKETNELIIEGETDRSGIYKGTAKLGKDEEVYITFKKRGFTISPKDYTGHPKIYKSKDHPSILIYIVGEREGKNIVFRIKNSLPDVEIFGINHENRRRSLGRTNSRGEVKTNIKKTDYETISFEYVLEDAEVFSDTQTSFDYFSLPNEINLRAIPELPLTFNFYCKNKFTDLGERGVNIGSENIIETARTDRFGKTFLFVSPDRDNGPFIGDTLEWNLSKPNYTIFNKESMEIRAGKYSYPESGNNTPLTFSIARQYKIPINVEESNNPVGSVNIFINGEEIGQTDNTGEKIYTYYEDSIGNTLTFSVKKEGLSASPKNITLGNIERSLTFNVRTNHIFIRFIDSVTNDPVGGLTVESGGGIIGEQMSNGQVKLNFPNVGKYKLRISDYSAQGYLEKLYTLELDQRNIGKIKTVSIDPITGVSFLLVDAITGDPINTVSVLRNSNVVGVTDRGGRYNEDFVPDRTNSYTYSFNVNYYLPKEIEIYRHPGRQQIDLQLDKLAATIMIMDENGNPAENVEVYVQKLLGRTDNLGKFKFSPEKLNSTISIRLESPEQLYYSTEKDCFFDINGITCAFTIMKQSWIKLKLYEPGVGGVEGVNIITTNGITGKTDSNGIYIYRIPDESLIITAVGFKFNKSGYEELSEQIVPNGIETTMEIPMVRFQAYFYVVDSTTGQGISGLDVFMNGIKQSPTDEYGKAIINPQKKPSNLTIKIIAPDKSYIPIEQKIKFDRMDLGKFTTEKTPIEIVVIYKWASGAPINNGTLELDLPFQSHNITSNDGGEHIFKTVNRTLSPALTIKGLTPDGNPFKEERDVDIPASSSIFRITEVFTISTKPVVNIKIDDNVYIEIRNEHVLILERTTGSPIVKELPSYGLYTIIRTGKGFSLPDSSIYYIDKPNFNIDLTRKPHCQEADIFYQQRHWSSFINSVNNLSRSDDCYCELNKKAAVVSMDELADYADALQFYGNITKSSDPCYLTTGNPDNDPYVHLRMLECCVETEKDEYDKGEVAATKFNRRTQLLNKATQENSICEKDFYYGLLLSKKYWKLCDKLDRSTSSHTRNRIKRELSPIRSNAIQIIEDFIDSSCSSNNRRIMSQKLEQIKSGC